MFNHVPVLASEVVDAAVFGGEVVDATFGGGGYTKALLAKNPNISVIAIDQDKDAIVNGKALGFETVTFFHRNFVDIKEIVLNRRISFVMADLGFSTHQLEDGSRGFSFGFDAPLDMRMDVNSGKPLGERIKDISIQELSDIILKYGEEKRGYKIASFIKKTNVVTTKDLSLAIDKAIGTTTKDKRDDVQRRVYQALRIYVNDELSVLEKFLNDAIEVLMPTGRLAVVTFHSLEDRLVKQIFKQKSLPCVCPPGFPSCVCGNKREINLLNTKPIVATPEEVLKNPKSKSAKLRVIEKV